jgi:hypothetical protein
VCEEWRTFENFENWAVSHGYSDSRQIHRINSALGYFPENCEWLLPEEHWAIPSNGYRASRPSRARRLSTYLRTRSKYRGTRNRGRRWAARIRINRKEISLGTFDTEEEAHLAYLEAWKRYATSASDGVSPTAVRSAHLPTAADVA